MTPNDLDDVARAAARIALWAEKRAKAIRALAGDRDLGIEPKRWLANRYDAEAERLYAALPEWARW